MNKRIIAIGILGMFLLTSFTTISAVEIKTTATGNTIYVDDDFDSSTPGWQVTHFDKIQDGINAAVEDDKVYVYIGTYSEHIIVDNSITLEGEHRDTTVIEGTVEINANQVNMSKFTVGNINTNKLADGICIKGSYNTVKNNMIKEISCEKETYGICVEEGSHNNLINNDITAISSLFWAGGISFGGSHHKVLGNTITNINSDEGNNIVGIDFSGNYNTIEGNTITNIHSYGADSFGIAARETYSNIITGNTIKDITGKGIAAGIFLEDSNNHNTITRNTIKNIESSIFLAVGIYFTGSFNNVKENRIINIDGYSVAYGICGFYGYVPEDNNTIEGNTITDVQCVLIGVCGGISLNHDVDSTIKGNTVTDIARNNMGTECRGGLILSSCLNVTIEENIIKNIINIVGYGIWLGGSTDTLITHNDIYVGGEERSATFNFQHCIDDGEFDETKISSNTWYQNYWNKPRYSPKTITGKLVIVDRSGGVVDVITKYNEDPDPLLKPYNGNKAVSSPQLLQLPLLLNQRLQQLRPLLRLQLLIRLLYQ